MQYSSVGLSDKQEEEKTSIERKSDTDTFQYPYRFFLLLVRGVCHNTNKFFQKRAL